jgi:hypothetical protein
MLSHTNKQKGSGHNSNYESIIHMTDISGEKSILSVLMTGEGKTADKCIYKTNLRYLMNVLNRYSKVGNVLNRYATHLCNKKLKGEDNSVTS